MLNCFRRSGMIISYRCGSLRRFILVSILSTLLQEYPTEPLDKIPALQGRIALAGKLNIGHMHLLENIYKHYSGWEFMLQRWL